MGACTVRGLSAFCPSDQTCGTIANSPLITSDSSPIVATSGGMEPPSTSAVNDVVNDILDSSDDDLTLSIPVQAPSMISPKRKHSALDDGTSGTSYSSKRMHKSASSGASALHGIKDIMAGISTSMRNGPLGQPHHHRRSSAEHRIEATALLQQKEDLMVDQMVAFADLFEQTTAKADTYMALIWYDVQKLWVQRQLVELGSLMVGSGSQA